MKHQERSTRGAVSRWRVGILLVAVYLCSCATAPPARVYPTPAALQRELDGDTRTLASLRPQLAQLDLDFTALRETGDWQKRGYFSVDETNQVAALLFRCRGAHSALWDITAAYQNMKNPFVDSVLDAKAAVLARGASLLLASHCAFLVAEFAKDPVAVAKMNEAFYRLEIPRDTYYEVSESIDSERLSRLRRSGALAASERADPDSALSRLAASDASYAGLVERNATLQDTAEARMRAALEAKGASAPELIHEADESVERGLYVARSVLFKDVSRLKSPTAHLVRFSNAQKAEVYGLLRPGDLILTYTAGYTSDVFIPGAFKHGITFIGSPKQREQAGLTPDALPDVAPDARNQLAAHVARASLEDGKPADMIEAVAEGVIFNNLAHIMDTHINRLLVLRPQLTESERTDFLVEVFSSLGEEYDFRFDFADSTRQVCTEVIYRAIQGKGGIEFHLTVRAGHETLSADDISLYYLAKRPEGFEFVLYAEEDPESKDHAALILTGDTGIARLKELMKSVGE
jgi:hypothetical protein